MQRQSLVQGMVRAGLARLPRTAASRAVFFMIGDVVLWVVSLYLAFLLRFDGVIPAAYVRDMPVILTLTIPLRLALLMVFRLYQVSWHQVGVKEVVQALKALTIAALGVASGLLLLRDTPGFAGFPRSVLIFDYLLSAALVLGFRLSRRMVEEFFARRGHGGGTRVLVIGAGAAGERVTRAMLEGNGGGALRHPVALIDDDPSKHRTYVHGLKVFGGREFIPEAVKRFGIQEVIIAVPSAPPAAIREFVRYSREAGVTRIKVIPSMDELLTSRLPHQVIRDVKLEDLLGRELVRLESGQMRRFLAGKTVLVTGAGGSIGSELARQLAGMDAAQLFLVDSNESALFDLQGELSQEGHTPVIQYVVADIRDGEKIRRLFGQSRPDVVYHAAAYKHVPLMELHADEAVRTNVFGTMTVAEAALEHATEAFVLISTDKAVSPTSVMGSTKRVAEMVIKALNGRGTTRFMAVRFGNVIGSRGSVIPVMQEQIRRGGPVTVTHPEMTRYFMSTREAVALVLQASAAESSHEVLVLDMGEPVRILELAQELIRLSGFEPDREIPIVFTGIRPGEKLHEALETADEPLEPTAVPKVLAVATSGRLDEVTLRLALQELDRLSRVTDMTGIRGILRRLTTEPGKIPLWTLGS
jgi:FlaA1/EpsC-like NDP-sugar epimerase